MKAIDIDKCNERYDKFLERHDELVGNMKDECHLPTSMGMKQL